MPGVYSFVAKFNTVDVATYGFIVSELPNNWDAPAITIAEVQVPGRRGPMRTTAKKQYAPMDYVLKGNLIGTSSSDLESKKDTLAAATYGDVAVIAGNQTSRQRTGNVSIAYGAIYPAADEIPITVTIHCVDPLLYATSATTVSGSSGIDLACALGTEDSYPVVTVSSSPTSPLVLTYKDHTGATIQTLTVTFPGSPTSVVIDMLNQTVTAGGVRHDEYLTAGDFFALRASDGVFGSSSPSVRASSGAPSIVYTQAFR